MVLCALCLGGKFVACFCLQVDEGGRVPLPAHHRFAADDESAAREDLRVTVTTLPVYGYLENTRTGKSLGYGSFLLPEEGSAGGAAQGDSGAAPAPSLLSLC